MKEQVQIMLLFFLFPLLTIALDEDPEIFMDTPKLIEKWGYPVEIHNVVTEDGYGLVLHRIPHGRNDTHLRQKEVIFLQHGLLSSSADWVVNLPSESAGFFFADAGFDVWMGNTRGNNYSLAHTSLSANNSEYWNFSWDEMSHYDLPAMVNYVLNQTGKESLYYVGHSQGTLIMFTHLSEDQEFTKKIKLFFALAPIGSMKHIRGLSGVLFRDFQTQLQDMKNLCSELIFSIGGPQKAAWNTSRSAVYLAHFPSGTSNQNMEHWEQMILTGEVRKFDFGNSSVNFKYYNQTVPSLYDYRNIKCPIVLFYGGNDYLADVEDVKNWLIPNISSVLKSTIFLPEFNHFDFIWGLDAYREVYHKIVDFVNYN